MKPWKNNMFSKYDMQFL